MVQLIGLPGLQFNPRNAMLDFEPLTRALHGYRQGMNEAEQWPHQRNALLAQTDLARQHAALYGAQADAARATQAQDAIIGQMLFGGLPAAASPSTATPVPVAQDDAAWSRPPQTIYGLGRSLTLEPGVSVHIPAEPASAPTTPTAPAGAGPAAAAPRNTLLPQSPPASPSALSVLSSALSPGNFYRLMQGAFGSQPTAPTAPGPTSTAPGVLRQIADAVAPPAAAQEPTPPADFADTPAGVMMRAPTGLTPATPAGPPATAAPPAAAAQLGGLIGSLPRDQQIAAYLLWRGRKWEDLAKLFEGAEGSARQSAAQERGKALGTAQANLPTALQAAGSMIRNIDAVIADPNLGWVTGWQSNWSEGSQLNPLTHLGNVPAAIANIPNIFSGPELNDTRERINQLIGQSFLQAYQSLRGGGQITEIEGAKAQAAIARLQNLAQSDAGYLTALNEARREIWDLMNVARVKAGLPPVPYQPPGQQQAPAAAPTRTAPAVGAIEDGYRFRGGDPGNPASWERVN